MSRLPPEEAGGSLRCPRRSQNHFASNPSFAGLVAFARRSDPIPSRTRPSNASAPMVLCLKTRESRSSPGLQRTEFSSQRSKPRYNVARRYRNAKISKVALGFRHEAVGATVVLHCLPPTPQLPLSDAGWSSPVARQAHNLKAAGSNPAPATKHQQKPPARNAGGFCVEAQRSPPSQPALSRRPFASKRPAETYKSRGQASQAPESINDVALIRLCILAIRSRPSSP